MENPLKNQSFKLGDLSVGESAQILSLANMPLAFRQRLMAVGLVPGVVMTLVRRAPLGCPLEFVCGTTLLCLRAHEVAGIQASYLASAACIA